MTKVHLLLGHITDKEERALYIFYKHYLHTHENSLGYIGEQMHSGGIKELVHRSYEFVDPDAAVMLSNLGYLKMKRRAVAKGNTEVILTINLPKAKAYFKEHNVSFEEKHALGGQLNKKYTFKDIFTK